MTKAHWSNRTEFIMAAVGSAIGLGNIWRFPYICYKNGGGAFLLPYFIAIFAAGIPILIMKFALGQSTGYGAPKALGATNKNWKWLGWMAVLVGFGIVSYYSVVMGWSFNYLWYSFTMEWGSDPEQIGTFFQENVLQLTTPDKPGAFNPVWPIVIGLVLTWVAIYFSIWKGVKTVSKVIWVTVPLPVLLLIILIIRGLTLDGATEGVLLLLTPDVSKLADMSVWLDAFGQVFFSLSLGFGIMIAYASHNRSDADVANSAFSTGIWNSLFSYLAGFAVFSALGFLAVSLNKEVAEVAASGPGLAFVVFPTILAKLPFANVIFSVLFFLMLLMLGIDSAFSIVEAISKAVKDYFPKVKGELVALVCCALMFVAALLYTTRCGLVLLDITDHYFNIGLVIVCFLECVLIGWIVKPTKLREFSNSVSDFKIGRWWDFMIMFTVPLILFVLLMTNIYADTQEAYEGYPRVWLLIYGWIPLGLTYIVGLVLSRSWRMLAFSLGFVAYAWLIYALIPLTAEANTILIGTSAFFIGGIVLTTLGGIKASRRRRIFKAMKESRSEETD